MQSPAGAAPRLAPAFDLASATRMVLLPSLVGVALTGAVLSCVDAPVQLERAVASGAAGAAEEAKALEPAPVRANGQR